MEQTTKKQYCDELTLEKWKNHIDILKLKLSEGGYTSLDSLLIKIPKAFCKRLKYVYRYFETKNRYSGHQAKLIYIGR